MRDTEVRTDIKGAIEKYIKYIGKSSPGKN